MVRCILRCPSRFCCACVPAAAHLRCSDEISQLWWRISSQQLTQQPIKRLAAFIICICANGPYEAEQEMALQQRRLLLLRQLCQRSAAIAAAAITHNSFTSGTTFEIELTTSANQ